MSNEDFLKLKKYLTSSKQLIEEEWSEHLDEPKKEVNNNYNDIQPPQTTRTLHPNCKNNQLVCQLFSAGFADFPVFVQPKSTGFKDKLPGILQLRSNYFQVVIQGSTNKLIKYKYFSSRSKPQAKLLQNNSNSVQLFYCSMIKNNPDTDEIQEEDEDEDEDEDQSRTNHLTLLANNSQQSELICKTFHMFQWYQPPVLITGRISGTILGTKYEKEAVSLRLAHQGKACFSCSVVDSKDQVSPVSLQLNNNSLTILTEEKEDFSLFWLKCTLEIHKISKKVLKTKQMRKFFYAEITFKFENIQHSILFRFSSKLSCQIVCKTIRLFITRNNTRTFQKNKKLQINQNYNSTRSWMFRIPIEKLLVKNPNDKNKNQNENNNQNEKTNERERGRERGSGGGSGSGSENDLNNENLFIKLNTKEKERIDHNNSFRIGWVPLKGKAPIVQELRWWSVYSNDILNNGLILFNTQEQEKQISTFINNIVKNGFIDFKINIILKKKGPNNNKERDTAKNYQKIPAEISFNIDDFSIKIDQTVKEKYFFHSNYKYGQRIIIHPISTIFVFDLGINNEKIICFTENSKQRDFILNSFLVFWRKSLNLKKMKKYPITQLIDSNAQIKENIKQFETQFISGYFQPHNFKKSKFNYPTKNPDKKKQVKNMKPPQDQKEMKMEKEMEMEKEKGKKKLKKDQNKKNTGGEEHDEDMPFIQENENLNLITNEKLNSKILELKGLPKTIYYPALYNSLGEYSCNCEIRLFKKHFEIKFQNEIIRRNYSLFSRLYFHQKRSLSVHFNIDEFHYLILGFPTVEKRIGFNLDFTIKRNKCLQNELKDNLVFDCSVKSTNGFTACKIILKSDCFLIKTHNNNIELFYQLQYKLMYAGNCHTEIDLILMNNSFIRFSFKEQSHCKHFISSYNKYQTLLIDNGKYLFKKNFLIATMKDNKFLGDLKVSFSVGKIHFFIKNEMNKLNELIEIDPLNNSVDHFYEVNKKGHNSKDDYNVGGNDKIKIDSYSLLGHRLYGDLSNRKLLYLQFLSGEIIDLSFGNINECNLFKKSIIYFDTKTILDLKRINQYKIHFIKKNTLERLNQGVVFLTHDYIQFIKESQNEQEEIDKFYYFDIDLKINSNEQKSFEIILKNKNKIKNENTDNENDDDDDGDDDDTDVKGTIAFVLINHQKENKFEQLIRKFKRNLESYENLYNGKQNPMITSFNIKILDENLRIKNEFGKLILTKKLLILDTEKNRKKIQYSAIQDFVINKDQLNGILTLSNKKEYVFQFNSEFKIHDFKHKYMDINRKKYKSINPKNEEFNPISQQFKSIKFTDTNGNIISKGVLALKKDGYFLTKLDGQEIIKYKMSKINLKYPKSSSKKIKIKIKNKPPINVIFASKKFQKKFINLFKLIQKKSSPTFEKNRKNGSSSKDSLQKDSKRKSRSKKNKNENEKFEQDQESNTKKKKKKRKDKKVDGNKGKEKRKKKEKGKRKEKK
ncbi:nnp-1 protein putative nuclear protein 1 nop52 [Anaeramoeba flamelloides]|uniref:Nnp-1 protein putative nuclear protein 1 nop52 n=1 Tax=Anaeramoeba flamelloides TaxID=1746091 RepID=A0ABQ8XJ69_9EUKA|nr:nnp-1 protein putative nuclear protein 1 nop52 [Anaeramoeba flamelloides]